MPPSPKIHLRSNRGHLEVIWWLETQVWWAQSTQRPKNLWKEILHAPKWDLARKLCFQVVMGHLRSFGGHKVLFWGQYGSLEVIWRTFGDSKLKSDKRNQLSNQSNLWKDILHAPKWDLVRELCFQVLEVIWRLETLIWWVQSTQRSKKSMRRHITCPKVRFGKEVKFWGPYGSLEVI